RPTYEESVHEAQSAHGTVRPMSIVTSVVLLGIGVSLGLALGVARGKRERHTFEIDNMHPRAE
ncbi:hypothetical protein T492DRAFT_871605, partial [Pavlovales sp. CCMP2436]